ncbi:class I SAM-dependent methyltransferase [Bacillus sp. FJAT-47783]|uniref:class I SAM-dependent methyltransferase n=1 Tax=Bacillus sp. FJAT-47783 TaxID=2922712 RepID=UPI001FAE095E|nr:class I SAM-dependent methyltransferase [Bacillus sp. FJAT-47783]
MNGMSNVEKLFTLINETAVIIQKELDCTYIEAVAETGDNLFHQDVLQPTISELGRKKLTEKFEHVEIEAFSKEEIRKAYQLAVLKGLKEASHPNHQMTPDTVGLFLSYLIGKFLDGQNHFRLLDPAVGAGNLLTTVLNQLKGKDIQAIGVDVDELLLKLACISANLQEHPIEFFHQDSLQPLLVDPVDVSICDLPVGYYPNDAGAQSFQVKADKGHSYAHHLFIEQCINYTKPGGYLFFIIPNNLFETEEAPKLNAYLKEQAIIQGLIQLPLSLFKKGDFAKSIFILQKKADHVKQPKQALLAELPKFSNREAMASIMAEMNEWFSVNK